MDYDAYRNRYFTNPMPEPRFSFLGSFGMTLFYQDYQDAVSYYSEVLGPHVMWRENGRMDGGLVKGG